MKTYTINSECGLMDIEAESVEDAKDVYSRERQYDFDAVATTDGSWYWIAEDGVRIEDETEDMP